MEDIFFTVTGCNHYFGTEAFKPRMKVTLYKEPDNKYDKEAIRVEARALGKIGYAANKPVYCLGRKPQRRPPVRLDRRRGDRPGALRPAARAGLRAGRDWF